MDPLRLGWATYAMPERNVLDVLPRLADIGYETVELTVSEGYTASPDRLDRADRTRLVEALQSVGFTAPALMDLIAPCSRGTARDEVLAHFEAACELCRDLHYGDEQAVVKSPITGDQPSWEEHRERILTDLLEVADIAASFDVIFAVEAHVGTALDSPDKVRWLMETTDHPHLGINFDISHFPTDQFDPAAAIEACGPYAVHTHVKDSVLEDGDVHFRVPGETDFDYDWFFPRLLGTGYRGDIIAELSAQQWRLPDFDTWSAAQTAYENLVGPVTAANEAVAGAIED